MPTSKHTNKRTASRTRRRSAALTWTKSRELTLKGAGGRSVVVMPMVVHSIDDPPAFHLGKPTDEPYLTHRFLVGISSEDLGDSGDGSHGLWTEFPAVTPPSNSEVWDGSFRLVAELELFEFPVRRVDARVTKAMLPVLCLTGVSSSRVQATSIPQPAVNM